MLKKIIFIILGLAVLTTLFLWWQPDMTPTETVSGIKTDKKDSSLIPDFTLPFSKDPKDLAWRTFEEYLKANQDQDLEKLKTLVYKVAPICDDPKTILDCKARMGLAYQYGSALHKADFVNVWEDDKQLILTTNFWHEESADTFGRFRSIIFFLKSENGSLKLLSFSPFKGVGLQRGEASIEELKARAIRYTEDKDEDGVADYTEECLDAKAGVTCTKTDPRSRDSDSDGFWDGIEMLM